MNNQGAALFLAIIMITAVIITIAVSVSVLGIGELDMSYTAAQSENSTVVADACAEEGLRRLRIDDNWAVGAGPQALNIGSHSCTIEVATDGGDERTITSISVVGDYYTTVEAIVDVSNNDVELTSWEINP